MKFKTAEEAVAWVKGNLVETEGGEFAIKESVDLTAALEKKSSDYSTNTAEKEKFKIRAQSAESKVKELETSLAGVQTELEGLKTLKTGDYEEKLQKLNKEKSELATKLNTAESSLREFQAKIDEIPKLQGQLETIKAENDKSKILAEVRRAAVAKKVPQSVIDSDFERLVVCDFEIDETGKVWAKGDTPKSVENYIVEKQKERPHWQLPSTGANAEPGKPNTTTPVSVGGLFET